MAKAIINNTVLQWATNRIHATAEDLANSVNVRDVSKVEQWLVGKQQPTFRQAQKLAKILRIPFGYLFLESPPAEELPIPDLRTVGDSQAHELTPGEEDSAGTWRSGESESVICQKMPHETCS